MPPIFAELRTMYTFLDEVHSATQKLQQFMVNLTSMPLGCEGDEYGLDFFILLGAVQYLLYDLPRHLLTFVRTLAQASAPTLI